MANLIITIISIALVAVAALMGAYYGGSAFLSGQVKAQANQALTQAEQIAAAWKLYALDRNGNRSLSPDNESDWHQYGVSVLRPNYLSSIPKLDKNILPASYISAWSPRTIAAWGTDYATANGLGVVLANTASARSVCVEVAQRARGSSAQPIACTPTPSNCNGQNFTPTKGQFDCFYEDMDASATLNDGDNPILIYKVF